MSTQSWGWHWCYTVTKIDLEGEEEGDKEEEIKQEDQEEDNGLSEDLLDFASNTGVVMRVTERKPCGKPKAPAANTFADRYAQWLQQEDDDEFWHILCWGTMFTHTHTPTAWVHTQTCAAGINGRTG